MALSEAERAAMRSATHDAAWHMADDLKYIRETIAKKHLNSGDVRRMSNVLRRLLIDSGGDLNKIAPPRLNRRLMLLAPNMVGLKEHYQRATPHIASIGTSGVFGRNFFLFDIFASEAKSPDEPMRKEVRYEHAEPNPNAPGELVFEPPPVSVSQDKFLAQQVLWCWNRWIRRREILKYVANVAGGVHSGGHTDPVDQLLQSARNVGSLVLVNGAPQFRVHPTSLLTGERPIDIERDGIDFVLLQILCAARYLAMSPDIIELEAIIQSE